MLVDMYNIHGVSTPGFMDKMKKTLNHRPIKCMGVRLLMNLHDNSHYILVSYWPDEESMMKGTTLLHRQIMKIADANIRTRTENYEIGYEI